MNVVIQPHGLQGTVSAIASKSMAHRLLILAASTSAIVDINCSSTSDDIQATIECLEALGACITRTTLGYRVRGMFFASQSSLADTKATFTDNSSTTGDTPAILNCGESGSTLRFMLPVVAALGKHAYLVGQGRLATRPLEPLYSELCAHGCFLSEQGSFPLEIKGKLSGGVFHIPGNVSSQYISGLLLAAGIAQLHLEIIVSKPFESKSYVKMTIDALEQFGINVAQTQEHDDQGQEFIRFSVDKQTLSLPRQCLTVEGDWSGAGFWLCAAALGNPLRMSGLSLTSSQGDKAILACLAAFGARTQKTASYIEVGSKALRPATLPLDDIVDLAPPLAALACFANGTTKLTHASRLRLKESDRILSITTTLQNMGADISSDADTIYIHGHGMLDGGEVECFRDHRIAMMATIAAAYAQHPTTIRGAECVRKSYPTFFEDFVHLGGYLETKDD